MSCVIITVELSRVVFESRKANEVLVGACSTRSYVVIFWMRRLPVPPHMGCLKVRVSNVIRVRKSPEISGINVGRIFREQII